MMFLIIEIKLIIFMKLLLKFHQKVDYLHSKEALSVVVKTRKNFLLIEDRKSFDNAPEIYLISKQTNPVWFSNRNKMILKC
jgi:hypothetical protein